MKKEERQVASDVIRLFREGKLGFSYFYNPTFTFGEYDTRDDHEFIVEYNGIEIRLRRKQIIITDKKSKLNYPPSMSFSLTKELKEIYGELYEKHKQEIEEVITAQLGYKEELDSSRTQAKSESYDTTTIVKKLQQ